MVWPIARVRKLNERQIKFRTAGGGLPCRGAEIGGEYNRPLIATEKINDQRCGRVGDGILSPRRPDRYAYERRSRLDCAAFQILEVHPYSENGLSMAVRSPARGGRRASICVNPASSARR
jgi:hypothetical protein